MTSEFNPWNPAQMGEEPPPFERLLGEARAALARTDARPDDVRRRYREAIARGAEHLDAPPSLDEVAEQLDGIALDADYDDGPFEEALQISPLPPAAPRAERANDAPRRRRPRPAPAVGASHRIIEGLASLLDRKS